MLWTHLPFTLDLVVQGEAASVAHQLWSLRCWLYRHPSRGHGSIVMQLQKSYPTFNVGIDVRKKIKGCTDSKHMAMWQGLNSTQIQTRRLISGPNPTAKSGPLSFNRVQSSVGTGLLTGYNTLRRHLYIKGLIDSPFCRGCGAEEETSAHVLCECQAFATLRHSYLDFIFEFPCITSL